MAPAFATPLPGAPAVVAPAAASAGAAPARRAGIPLWAVLGGAGVAAIVVAAIAATVVYFLLFSSRVTQANFDRIRPAMTRAEVEEILGKPTQSQDIPFLNVNASVWSDKQKAIVVWYQNDKEINKIITDGQVNVSRPPAGMNLNALSSGKDASEAPSGAADDKDEGSAAPAAAVGPNPEQQREMEAAFRDAMKTFSKNGQPAAAAPQAGGADATSAKGGKNDGAAPPPKPKPAADAKAKTSTQADAQQGH